MLSLTGNKKNDKDVALGVTVWVNKKAEKREKNRDHIGMNEGWLVTKEEEE